VGSIVSIASQSKRGDVSATHPEGREEVSIFTPEADMSGVEVDVRYVPKADIRSKQDCFKARRLAATEQAIT
jgi:hypothetical protein